MLGVLLSVSVENAQDEVDVVAEERTHDERECASGEGEQ
jgi:hypothetical protein